MILKGASHVHSLTLVLCKPKKITAKGLNNSTVNSWWREKRPLPLSRMPLNQLLSKIMVALAQLQRGKGTKAYSQSNMTMVAMGKNPGKAPTRTKEQCWVHRSRTPEPRCYKAQTREGGNAHWVRVMHKKGYWIPTCPMRRGRRSTISRSSSQCAAQNPTLYAHHRRVTL